MPTVDPFYKSLYAETAVAAPSTVPLRGSIKSDVVIVGGGFTGLSSALHAARKGLSVTVLEAQEPGWGASGRNGGQVNPGLKHEPEQIEHDFGKELAGRMIALSGNAPDRVFKLIDEHGIECDAARNGTIRAAYSQGSAAFLERATDALKQRGFPVELLDETAMAKATGTNRYIRGALDRRGGSVNPLSYARGLANAAIKAGVAVHSQTRATALSRHGSKWIVTVPGGKVEASWVVLATNAYTDDLWPGLRRTVVPVFSGIVATEPLPEEISSRILPQGSVLYEHESITVYYRLDSANRLLMGGRSRLRPLADPSDFRDLIHYAVRLWPALAKIRWEYGWNGQLAITPNHYPHVHQLADNLLACLAYNGRGIAMATAMGGEIARAVSGTPLDHLDMPVTGMKPISFHGLWPVAATARIAYGRMRNRLGL